MAMADVMNIKLLKYFDDNILLRKKDFSILEEVIHLVKCHQKLPYFWNTKAQAFYSFAFYFLLLFIIP